ncbi:ATP-binding protein [Streptomyces sp. NPDC026672]|uniref:ATP-binding protein n=1 Tax=unclassified Streptomyces TaxID=2593676 RepID=UPI0033FB0A83
MTLTVLDGMRAACMRPGQAVYEVSIARDRASDPGRLTQADAVWPGRLRRIVRAALAYWGRPDLIEPAELLTTELATNALRHGTGTVGFRLCVRDEHLVIEVRDGSPQRPVLRRAALDDESGRGLVLVDALADAWGTSPDGTTTWCRLSLRKGPDAVDRVEPLPLVRRYPTIRLAADAKSVIRARLNARTSLTVIGWAGSVDAAAAVLADLVHNALLHGLPPTSTATISVDLGITEDGRLVIDVCDPTPRFPDFTAALQNGRGLQRIQQLGAGLTWFIDPTLCGKTVRATLTPGPVDL